MFNYEGKVIFYNKDMIPVILSNNFNNSTYIMNYFSGIDLMA